MKAFQFTPDSTSPIPKFKQLIQAFQDAISQKILHPGDVLPSVNEMCRECSLSRDTVFKSYAELKKRNVIESVPNKGYFVSGEITRVFLFLDTFKAYKEVLYDSFRKNLAANVIVDLHFHHYNIDVFKSQIRESVGKYSKYIIMNFDHPKVATCLKKLDPKNVMIIDWNINADDQHSQIFQDFGESVLTSLQSGIKEISKYKEFCMLYPDYTYHSYDTVEFFNRFCQQNKIKHSVCTNMDAIEVKKGTAYFSVSDRAMVKILDKAREKKFEFGKDVGLISYNETPMKKYIDKGITVISTDFNLMGKKVAEFVMNSERVFYCVPTKLVRRKSL
ncbi:GntR family transcriptional regulator [Labilibaculum filiforme]|uniref:GntR family transcriptional regulator n=1 Tax=Labilibaculum filiforme TaxID=1940526 RepID=A0A2N3I3H7_9BACT|nr:GntR family transcriptional regulator [Labilibaculum filiforme]PKQ64849.1 GntR family transcriptional regulator [Labilibaculum filiforme]